MGGNPTKELWQSSGSLRPSNPSTWLGARKGIHSLDLTQNIGVITEGKKRPRSPPLSVRAETDFTNQHI